MKEPATLVGLLRQRAEELPDRKAFVFLLDGEEEGESLTYAGLDLQARRIAALLLERGLRGERVLLLYPPGLSFVAAYFGCLYAGAVAVPVYPPRHNRTLDRLQAIVADAGARAVLATDGVIAGLREHAESTPGLSALQWLSTDAVEEGRGWADPGIAPADVAFLQYTSGSTSTPKGVRVTHRNLLANERMLREAFGHSEGLVVVGWLPVYHDMGLIGNVLHPLYMGGQCVLMSPSAFLQRPVRWLNAVSRYGAETSGGPNFAYELCVDRIPEEEKAALELSAWRVAFCGAEPVRAATLERFSAAFAGCGFRREAFYPCYGLAEATLFVTGGERSAPPVVRPFDAAALGEDRAVRAGAEGASTLLVGCGVPWHEGRVEVVHPRERTRCAPGEVGEVWVAGPHVSRGYWNRPEESELAFGGYLRETGEGPFLRTGDLGFLDGGELFVTGRLKDLIILRGRNVYPQDVEAAAQSGHAALQPGGGAAFSVEAEGEERLVVVHEVRRTALRGLDAEEVAAAIREAVAAAHEAQVHAVVLIRPATLPKTSSGKVQRRACRAAYLAGELQRVASSVLSGAEGSPPPEGVEGDASPGAGVEGRLRTEAARVLRLPVSGVDPERPLTSLGLDSLSAARLAGWVEESLRVRVDPAFFLEQRPLADLAREIALRPEEGARAELPEPGAGGGGAPEGPHPLSAGQRALWFLYRLAPESAAYNVAAALGVRGALDARSLEEALRQVVARHAALRTVFREDEPLQTVLGQVEVSLAVADAASWSPGALRERLAEEAHRPFRLSGAPLLRAHLFRRGEGEHVLLLVAHHAVLDFRSLEVVLDELLRAYLALREGTTATLPDAAVQHPHFVRWQEELLAGPEGERLREHWAAHLRDAPTVLDLPTDRPRPPVQGYRGGAHPFSLDPALSGRVRALARAEGVTLYTLLLAAFELLLHRYTGEHDFLVGSPTAGRTRPALEGVVGYLVNPVVLRARLGGGPSFRELLRRTHAEVLSALSAQGYPFERLVEQLHPERDASRSPLFQAMFAFQRASHLPVATACALGHEGGREERGPLVLEPVPVEVRSAQLDLALAMGEVGEEVAGSLQYDAELFEPATAARMAGHLRRLLEAAVGSPEAPVSALPLLSAEERGHLVEGFDRVETVPRDAPLVHRLFERQAARTPEAVALVHGTERLTYAELERRANRLAHLLRARGVGPERRVGIMLRRTPELVVALLAVLKAGGAYVPLDPDHPAERTGCMLADGGVSLVLTGEPPGGGVRAHGVDVLRVESVAEELAVLPDSPPESGVEPEGLSHVIFTSGSTGRPKGVMIRHRSVAVLLHWLREAVTDEERSRVLGSTSVSFDVSVAEIFGTLCWGGTLVLVENALELARLGEEADIRYASMVPTAAAELLRMGAIPGSVRTLNLAGEALPGALAQALYATGTVQKVGNLYGPTEDTSYSTSSLVEKGAGQVLIGRPVSGTRAYVLDGALQPVPLGVPGELYLAGEGLARGYHGRPDATAERFVPDPFATRPGGRLYRTGDLARWRADGVLEFLGRADQQVKVRGHRIEPGEIETALAGHPAVRESVVVARDDGSGERRLVAYVVPATREAPPALPPAVPAGERERILEGLPRYTLPGGAVVAHQQDFLTAAVYREVFEDGVYLRHGITLEDGACVVDVGSNMGMFTLFAHARARGVRSYSFEPIPDTFAVLSANARLFGLDARVFNAGLAERSGTARFTYYPNSSGLSGRYADVERDREVTRSVIETWLAESGRDAAEEEVEALLDERFRSETFDCPIRTLSDVIREEGITRIDYLKVDAEKSEYDVLLGIEEEHWPLVRQVVMEVDTEELLEKVTALLGRHGYEHLVDRHVTVRAGAGEGDAGEHVYMLYARRPGDGAPLRRSTPADGGAGAAPPSASELRRWLGERLPDYMVPSLFVALDALPLTPNGKVDRRALPEAKESRPAPEVDYAPPGSVLEETISGVWQEVLGVERVGVRDNFFELGGTSIRLATVHRILSERLEREIAIVDLFRHPTVAGLAEFLGREGEDGGARERARDRAARQRAARGGRQRRERRQP